MEMYRPKSRTELYKEKLKERDLYTNIKIFKKY